MKRRKLLKKTGGLFVLAILVGLLLPQQSLTQTAEQYFEETGHWVSGAFLDYFNSQGGLEIFGYPITEPFVDQGVSVQYFQKARMEWHPNNPDPYKVQLGLLGDELKYRHSPIPAPAALSRRKVYFPETGHTLAYAFLDYFNAHGGIDLFGYPITEMHFEDGKIVQYFQRVKMEWHPNDPTSTVRLGDLGEQYVNIYRDRMPPEALRPVNARPDTESPTAAPRAITGMRAIVSLRYSVMSQKRNQVVSVLVTDINGEPLPGAQVTISFETASGEMLPTPSQVRTTDSRGFIQDSIPIEGGRSGMQIIVRAQVTYGDLSTAAQNVFLLWW
jgi:hypothetical protein